MCLGSKDSFNVSCESYCFKIFYFEMYFRYDALVCYLLCHELKKKGFHRDCGMCTTAPPFADNAKNW